MDKNTLLGFGLLIALLCGYLMYNQHAQTQFLAKQQADSIANVKLHPELALAKKDTATLKNATTSNATVLQNTLVDSSYKAQTITLENEDVIISFSNKGAYPTQIELKKYKTFYQKPLNLFAEGKNKMDLLFKSNAGALVHTADAVFNLQKSADGKSLTCKSNDSSITLNYTLPAQGYLLDIQATTNTTAQPITLEWNTITPHIEQDITAERQYTQVSYKFKNDGFDYETISKEQSKTMANDPLQFVCYKQHYFNTAIFTDKLNVTNSTIKSNPTDTATHTISNYTSMLTLSPATALNFQLYAGPNDLKILKSFNNGFDQIIPLGYGIFQFVKYINNWLVIPIFDALSKVFSNFGWVILVLTFIIRLLMSPFTYKSYVSGAKMKALKPEIDALKEKHGEDKQTFGMEQMKLFRSAGVNPLGGCLPALLQLPVFFALLSFFPNAIQLRQHKFLWAKDLSTYDSIYDLPFNIPFYGNHISLFTILFVITSLVLALYSMNMTSQDPNNPMMKWMPFIMPVMFLGIFNKLPASLTFYYFVSNVITLGLQFVIQNYIIRPDKIRAQIVAKQKEPPKQNKFMQRMQELQAQNEAKRK
jgi:YidC/Oxa1 family membrane protein insertase